ncbi:MAG TPA: hypothetical protein VGJ66_06935 [Pyrinomonadaceae bacterium]
MGMILKDAEQGRVQRACDAAPSRISAHVHRDVDCPLIGRSLAMAACVRIPGDALEASATSHGSTASVRSIRSCICAGVGGLSSNEIAVSRTIGA